MADQSLIRSERESFELSGPLHLTSVDWENEDHRRSVAASLVQGVYTIERDRQEQRQEGQALAPHWWEFFHFVLHTKLVDDADSSIFGAIYELKQTNSETNHSTNNGPRYVIAFRGTITKGDAFIRDFELDVCFIRNGLHQTSRFEIAIQAVRGMVATYGSSSIWLAGHSLGSAMAMHVGKSMAKTGIFLESFLFNPPYLSAPIERIKDKKVKRGIRIATSVITAGLAFATQNSHQNHHHHQQQQVDTFGALSSWIPCLYVNPTDPICAEYIGYFEHRKNMEEIGIGAIERLATKHSLSGLLMSAMGKQSEEAMHLLPSANLTVNRSPALDFKDAHGIHQWWRPNLHLESKIHMY